MIIVNVEDVKFVKKEAIFWIAQFLLLLSCRHAPFIYDDQRKVYHKTTTYSLFREEDA